MRNLRQLGTAIALSLVMGAGMVAFSPAVHAASDRSTAARCANLARAIAAAVVVYGEGSELVLYLQGEYAKYCSAQ